MGVAKALYSFGYCHFQVPCDTGPRQHLVELVENGRIPSCKVIDLGSGTTGSWLMPGWAVYLMTRKEDSL